MFINFATSAPVVMACPACGPVPAGAVVAECTTHHNVALRGEEFVDAAVNIGGSTVAAKAMALDADLKAAEALIEALLAKGDIDGAAALADALEASIMATHGLSA